MGDLSQLFNPATIALLGASEAEGSLGAAALNNLLESRDRKLFPVNPKHKTIFSLPCYPSIADLPEKVDLAVIATPIPTVPGLVEECGRAGIRAVIIFSAGFLETGQEGKAHLRNIEECRKRYEMRILGPNCLGFIRPGACLRVSFLRSRPEPGKIAFITQSAAFGKTLLDWWIGAHIGFSIFVSLGAAMDIDFGDMIDYLGNDPYTRSIVIYMEDTLGDVKKFISAIRGYARNKPIVLLRPTQLDLAQRTGCTHTAMLAGSDEAFDAVLKRVGVVRVRETQDLFNAASVLYSKHHPKGPNLAIISNAGGMGTLAANRLIRSGGCLVQFSPETLSALDAVMPTHCKRSNPVDVYRDADVGRFIRAIQICMDEPATDGVLVIYTPQAAAKSQELAEAILALSRSAYKLITTAWLGGQEANDGRDFLLKNSMPAYETAEDAVRSYVYLWNYERNLQLQYETPSELRVDEAPPKNHLKAIVRRVCNQGGVIITDEESRKFLKNYGIPTLNSCTATSADEAVASANEIGYPVVLKIASPDIIFRPDVGGVVTGINSDEELRSEYEKLMNRLNQLSPKARIKGVTVQSMIEIIDYEVILGARKDKEFGTVILFGMGGIGVQIYRDFAVGLPPLNQTLARRLMEETEVYRLLQGYRGKPPADLRQLEQILVSFSNLIVDFPEIEEMDINPIAISNGRAWALDARIVLDRSCPVPTTLYPHLVITPYPSRFVMPWRMPDGTEVLLRPIRPEDEPLQNEMLSTLSEESLRHRFFQTIKSISHEMHVRMCNIDYDREMAIVAELKENGVRRLIGTVRLIIEANGRRGEYAVIVHDDFQGRGLAYKLMDLVIGIAQEKGLQEFYGLVHPGNKKMLKMCAKIGMTAERTSEGLVRVRMNLY